MEDSPASPILLQTSRFYVTRETQVTSSGQLRQREIVRHPGSVVILPLVDDEHVCLIRNWRISVGQTLIELPAGTLEPPEPPRLCAPRELAEETGYLASDWELLASFYPAPGILDEQMHLFLARGLTLGETAREAGEEIENLVVSWDEALRMVRNREIQDGKTILALLLYQDRLRSRPALP